MRKDHSQVDILRETETVDRKRRNVEKERDKKNENAGSEYFKLVTMLTNLLIRDEN